VTRESHFIIEKVFQYAALVDFPFATYLIQHILKNNKKKKREHGTGERTCPGSTQLVEHVASSGAGITPIRAPTPGDFRGRLRAHMHAHDTTQTEKGVWTHTYTGKQ
jgi:hypothetical protein